MTPSLNMSICYSLQSIIRSRTTCSRDKGGDYCMTPDDTDENQCHEDGDDGNDKKRKRGKKVRHF